ncbi:hypothetical protein KVF89_27700 [Nocardioides carbamazepini]|uniref:hypothetical protein n=1 Tax=Nocardioides carbamazepini TaxID=2854259 RepID=UPI00214A6E83|nr:hypothetical protein [Nocardioides carbamazepini]MCR1786349.1 hypothetical protein [Nocardioides carbamazepini]
MMFDLRVFLLAALVAAPVAVLTAQGELTFDEALTRLLVVMVGATAAALAVRTLWPLLAGPVPDTLTAAPPKVSPEAPAGGPQDTAASAPLEAEEVSRPLE